MGVNEHVSGGVSEHVSVGVSGGVSGHVCGVSVRSMSVGMFQWGSVSMSVGV